MFNGKNVDIMERTGTNKKSADASGGRGHIRASSEGERGLSKMSPDIVKKIIFAINQLLLD